MEDAHVEHEAAYYPLMRIRNGQPKAPSAVCVPGAGGSVASFVELSKHLNQNLTIYGLQHRGMDGLLLPYHSISAASDSYFRAIETACLNDPFYLIGHSYGGWVAFELAHKLLASGRKVESLTIIDSKPPDSCDVSSHEYNMSQVSLAWIANIELLLERRLGIEQTDVESLNEYEQRDFLHRILCDQGIVSNRSSGELLEGPLRCFATALRTAWTPTSAYPESGYLVLADNPWISPEANLLRQREIIESWKAWFPKLEYRHISGNHMTVLRSPNAEILASFL